MEYCIQDFTLPTVTSPMLARATASHPAEDNLVIDSVSKQTSIGIELIPS
jgi:hypothetical protein